MIVYNNISLCLILATAVDSNVLGQFDQISHGNHVERNRLLTLTLDNFVHNKAGNAGKPKSLRGFSGVGTNEPNEIGAGSAGTVQAATIERINRLAGASARVSSILVRKRDLRPD